MTQAMTTRNLLVQAQADAYTERDARIDTLTAEYTVSYEAIKAMDKAERNELRNKIDAVLNNQGYIGDINLWDVAYATYSNLWHIEDDEYYEENIEAFREYESHYGEPDFDYGFYSDWHKDIFGFRPRH